MYAALRVTAALLQLVAASASASAPLATTRNGTYLGRYLAEYDQDLFLGMPYAQPPLGDLRFRSPQSLNTSLDGVRDASEYGYSCMQYHTAFNLSEDCLTVNVIRPSGNFSDSLPVLVWIYGGGLYTGSTADPQYNLSGVVKVSQDLGQPVIAVDMNYRLGMWGFLQTPGLVAEGSSNAGLLDQRLALRWIQENIAAFGGDPERVVVWGESAGAQSIAYHLFSYDGRTRLDGLYRGAIMESGGPTGAQSHGAGRIALLTGSRMPGPRPGLLRGSCGESDSHCWLLDDGRLDILDLAALLAQPRPGHALCCCTVPSLEPTD